MSAARRGRARRALPLALPLLLSACAHSLLSPRAASRVVEHEEHFTSLGHDVTVDHYSPGTAGRHPAVIVLHGSGGLHLFFGRAIQTYAEAMAASGFESYVVHYYDGTDTFVADDDEERRKFFDWVRIVSDAVTHIAASPAVRPRQISVMGQSLGAFLAVGVAAADRRIAADVVISGGLEPFLRDRITRMPPTLVLHGDHDDVVPLADGMALVDFLRAHHMPVEVHVYHDENHDLSDAHAIDAIDRARRFLRRKRAEVRAVANAITPGGSVPR